MYTVTIDRGLFKIGDVDLSACDSRVLQVIFPDRQRMLKGIDAALKEERRELTTRTTAGRSRQEETDGMSTTRT